MFKNNIYLLLIVLAFQSCFLRKHTDEQQVKKDVVNYLERKYHQKFQVANIKWACNEGNGCPDAHMLTCYPKDNPDLKFLVDVFYGDSLEIQIDEYKSELLDYDSEQALEKIIKPKFSLFKTSIDILAEYKQLDKYSINELNFEKVIKDYPNDISVTIYLYLLENKDEKRKEYIDMTRDIVARFGPLPVLDLSLDIFFYKDSAYSKISSEEINHIFAPDGAISKDLKNCEKEWNLQLERKDLKNLDSTIANIETFIGEHNCKVKEQ